MSRTYRFALTLCAALLSGCLEYHTTTRLHTDGSFDRTYTITGTDSASLARGNFALPVDSTWPHTIRKVEDKKWEMMFTRTFASAEEWESYQRAVRGRVRVLQFHVNVGTRFDWFRTRHQYTERFAAFTPFPLVPVTEFLSAAELERFFQYGTHKDSLGSPEDSVKAAEAETRFNAWQRRSEFESYFQALRRAAERSSFMLPADLDAAREKVYAAYLVATTKKDGGFEFLNWPRLERWLKLVHLRGWMEVCKAATGDLGELIEDSEFVDRVFTQTFSSSVIMPGTVVEHNAQTVEGSTLTWKDYLTAGYVADYTMTAESVTWNWWMVGLAGAIIVPGLVFAARRLFRRRLQPF